VPVVAPSLERPSSFVYWLACFSVKLIEVGFIVAVPALIPPALLVLLTALGAESTSIFLNGLAVGFVLELDNRVPEPFVSATEVEALNDFFFDLVTRMRDKELAAKREEVQVRSRMSAPRRSSAPFSNGGEDEGKADLRRPSTIVRHVSTTFASRLVEFRDTPRVAAPYHRLTDHGLTAPMRFVCTAVAFTFGWYTGTNADAGIHCEQLVHWFYYRVGLSFSVWLPFIAREVLEGWYNMTQTVILAWSEILLGEERSALDAAARKRYTTALVGLATRFAETLVCVSVMNFMWWLYNTIYWSGDIGTAWRMYGWGFVKDFFGFCAASGWADYWGMYCV
jgi:hypothetical protein